jgi:hypothetical protein
MFPQIPHTDSQTSERKSHSKLVDHCRHEAAMQWRRYWIAMKEYDGTDAWFEKLSQLFEGCIELGVKYPDLDLYNVLVTEFEKVANESR